MNKTKKRKNKSPQEQLKEKLYDVKFSSRSPKKPKNSFKIKEFVEKAKQVRKTFKNENLLQRQAASC